MSLQRTRLWILACIGIVVAMAPLGATPLPILVTAYPGNAVMAGTTNEAFIVVHLAKSDGVPNVKAEIPPQGPAGVELKNSKWKFQTLLAPPGYGALLPMPAPARPLALVGQLRIMSIAPYGINVEGDPQAGLYLFRVLPIVGLRSAPKRMIPWVAGEYRFMVSYRDGDDQGTAFGVLTIR
jgi:hypothetical protein